MGGTAWFFLARRDEEATVTSGKIKIVVDGGYHPAAIRVPAGQVTVLQFFRKDPSDCVQEVVIPELKIRQFLALNQTTDVTIKPTQPGTIPFQCGMGMIHGKIEVV
jgi:plastocyanin domain-containing protein